MSTYHLRTPVSEDDVRKLRINDVVYLSGDLFTARDEAHHRALKYHREGKELPINVKGKALYHCGPLVKEVDGQYTVVSAGPTTSMRMEMFECEFLEKFPVRIVIGKGGMGSRTTDAMKKFGAVYCAFTGGAAALAGKAIKSVKSVDWLDLGTPEALWTLEVEDFGPLTVAIDTQGRNLHADVAKQVDENKKKIYQMISLGSEKTSI
jgi:fumarate hydratase subunit beta